MLPQIIIQLPYNDLFPEKNIGGIWHKIYALFKLNMFKSFRQNQIYKKNW